MEEQRQFPYDAWFERTEKPFYLDIEELESRLGGDDTLTDGDFTIKKIKDHGKTTKTIEIYRNSDGESIMIKGDSRFGTPADVKVGDE